MNISRRKPLTKLNDSLLRPSEQVDLTQASASCRRCHGVGITGHMLKDDQRIPIVCRCVVRNGGVLPSAVDIPLTQGGRADEIVSAALRLPHALLPKCITALEKLLADAPADQRESERIFALKNARNVLVKRLASIPMTADEGATLSAPEETL